MPKHLVNLSGGGQGLLEIGSYGRRGPGHRDRLSPAQVALVARTVHRAPEVMVKVLNRGATNLGAVGRHFSYLSRKGKLDLQTDDGQRLSGKGSEETLLDDWDLDLDETRQTADLRSGRHKTPRLVHKLVFSMPPGTSSEKVLEAVKNLTREQFALKHRYAMVLHTDEPHPHVHVVVKAMGEDGKRLNIRKDTLRTWRREFARHLRDLGVAANATDRVVRGITRPQKIDGIFRADQRGGLDTHGFARGDCRARARSRGPEGRARPGTTARQPTRRGAGMGGGRPDAGNSAGIGLSRGGAEIRARDARTDDRETVDRRPALRRPDESGRAGTLALKLFQSRE